jgi:small subunit ribosomal protein S8
MENCLVLPRRVGEENMDKVAEFITAIRNSGTAKHEKVDLPSSNFRVGIAQVLLQEGFIRSFKVAKDSKQGIMRVYLKYNLAGEHAISNIKRVSRSGKRIYVDKTKIPTVRSGIGTSILSTSKGIMSGRVAKEQNVGGELLCTIW